MDNGDQILRRYRSDIHSMCASFPEPATAYKIRMEFDDNFGDEVPFRQFGYPSLDAFLNDHPDLDKVMHDGKACYRAKLTAATLEIQSLISKQKKKKKNRGAQGKKNRGNGLHRNNLNRSYRQINPQILPPLNRTANRGARSPFSFGGQQSTQYRPNPGVLGNPGANFGRPPTPKAAYHLTQPSVPPPVRPVSCGPSTVPARPVEPSGPEIGVQRIMRALGRCNGKATLTKLNWAYTALFNVELDGNEMNRHFKTNNMATIHRQYLRDKVQLNPGYNGQWSFVTVENAQRRKDWDQQHKDAVIDTPRFTWSYPTIKELYDKTVDMLVNMYPESIPLTSVAEYYKRTHSVLVDPQALYCKSWEDLVKTTFSDRLVLTDDKRVALNKKFAQSRQLSSQANAVHRSASAVKRVTAESLDLIYLEDSEDDDSDDYESEGSGRRCPTPTTTTIGATRLPHGLGGPPMPQNPFPQMRAFAPASPSKPIIGERPSIFSRMTFPTKQETTNVRKEPHKAHSTSAFDKKLPDIELPPWAPQVSSVFKRPPTAAKVPAREDEVDRLSEQMKKHAALERRMDIFDTLLEAERTRDMQNGFGFLSSTKKRDDSSYDVDFFKRAEEALEKRQETPTAQNRFTSSPFLKRIDDSAYPPQMTISPGNYNVKLNGRCEQLSGMIRSRQQPFDDDSSDGEAW